MTRFVVDATVLLAIADGTLDVHPSHQLVAPGAVRSQALSLLYRRARTGELDGDRARGLLERVAEIKVRLLNDRVSRSVAWRIADEHGWEDTADAELAAVTRLQADAFVTLDRALAEKLRAVVPVAAADALARP
ncbi:MAG TPA: hypothetical protein VI408_09275 [Gaiellaceae bacterium]